MLRTRRIAWREGLTLLGLIVAVSLSGCGESGTHTPTAPSSPSVVGGLPGGSAGAGHVSIMGTEVNSGPGARAEPFLVWRCGVLALTRRSGVFTDGLVHFGKNPIQQPGWIRFPASRKTQVARGGSERVTGSLEHWMVERHGSSLIQQHICIRSQVTAMMRGGSVARIACSGQ